MDANAPVGCLASLSRGWRVKRLHETPGVLAQTYAEAMRLWTAQKAEGLSVADRVSNLSLTLQAAWPRGRENAWQYLCKHCNDYGLSMAACPGDATCGKPKPHLAHEYGTPCWCPAGKRYRAKPAGDSQQRLEAGRRARTG